MRQSVSVANAASGELVDGNVVVVDGACTLQQSGVEWWYRSTSDGENVFVNRKRGLCYFMLQISE